jgi:hypothetical protein
VTIKELRSVTKSPEKHRTLYTETPSLSLLFHGQELNRGCHGSEPIAILFINFTDEISERSPRSYMFVSSSALD